MTFVLNEHRAKTKPCSKALFIYIDICLLQIPLVEVPDQ